MVDLLGHCIFAPIISFRMSNGTYRMHCVSIVYSLLKYVCESATCAHIAKYLNRSRLSV